MSTAAVWADRLRDQRHYTLYEDECSELVALLDGYSPTEIMTVSQVGGWLDMSDYTIRSLARDGELPGFKVGGKWRFSRAKILEMIEGRNT